MLLSGPDDLFISANVDEMISRLIYHDQYLVSKNFGNIEILIGLYKGRP